MIYVSHLFGAVSAPSSSNDTLKRTAVVLTAVVVMVYILQKQL